MSTPDSKHNSHRWIWAITILLVATFGLISIRGIFFRESTAIRQRQEPGRLGPTGSPVPAAEAPPSSRGTQAPVLPAAQRPATPAQAAGSAGSAIAIKGRVLSEATRDPVENANVRVYAHGSPPAVIDKATDADGRFRIEAPSAFRYGIRAEAEGFKPFQDDSLVITRPSYDIEILLTPTLTLRGRVLDNLGAGVGAALVRLRRQGERSGGFLSTTTDPQGAFLFTDIPRAGPYSVDAYHPGFDATGPANATVPSENEVLLRLRPARAIGSLTGSVTDTTRRPVAGARIMLFDPSDRRAQSQVQGQTDAQGVYRFAKVHEGYFVVRCSADGYLETRNNQGAVAVSANKEARLDFTLEPGFQIRGTVVNQKGEPVLQALLLFTAEDGQRASTPATATTDDSGRFQILNLRDTQYAVNVTHRDYLDILTHMRPSNQPQTITMDSGLSLRGTVSDPQGSAVERFSLIFQSTTSRYSKYSTLTTTDGKFEVQGLSRDTYQVRLQAGGTLYAGPLELQASTEVFIVLDPPPGGRTSREGRGGREGRGALPLNILKSK